jgi:hypothetical protein
VHRPTSRPPAPLKAAAASSGSGRLHTKPSSPPPPLAPTLAHQPSLVPCIKPPSPVQQSRRPPPMAASAPPIAGPLPAPTKHRNRAPRTRRTFSRPRPAGHGRRLAGFWPDLRRPAPRDPITSPQIFPGVHLRSKGISVTL